MKGVKQVFDFYLNSSIHVALSVCSLCYITMLEFNLEVDIVLLCFVFFASITGYNFVKYFGLAKFHHRSLATWLKYIQIFSFLCFIALTYFTIQLKTRTILYLFGLGVITFLYAIPFLPKKYFLDKGKNLRAISGLKVYVIAFVWSVTTVTLPLVNKDLLFEFDMIISFIQRFLFVLVLMLPFEIRDMNYDSLKLGTIPQQIGVQNTKLIGSVIIIIISIMEFFKDYFLEEKTVILIAIMTLTMALLWFSKVNQKAYYSSFWVESIPIIWLIITLAIMI
jgi:hypothetical protein